MPVAQTLDEVVAASVATRRFQMVSRRVCDRRAGPRVVGVYGVTSYAVQRRTQEIGVGSLLGVAVPGRRHLLAQAFSRWCSGWPSA